MAASKSEKIAGLAERSATEIRRQAKAPRPSNDKGPRPGDDNTPRPGDGEAHVHDDARPADATATGQAMHKGVGWALTVLARLHRVELGERLSALGLFPGQEQLLQALHDHETMTMGALAELMRVRPPTASKAVARLAAQGLVERVDSAAGDGRLVRVRLTATGRTRAAAVASLWREAEQRLLSGFDQRERKKLRKFLRRAAANFASDQDIARAAPVDDDAGTPESHADNG